MGEGGRDSSREAAKEAAKEAGREGGQGSCWDTTDRRAVVDDAAGATRAAVAAAVGRAVADGVAVALRRMRESDRTADEQERGRARER